jgi:hypothetical protein
MLLAGENKHSQKAHGSISEQQAAVRCSANERQAPAEQACAPACSCCACLAAPAMSTAEGSEMTMYLASGKKKHRRFFWLEGNMLSWDKSKSSKPNKSFPVTRAKPSADVKSAQQWFEHIDANGSGELDRDEVATLYRQAHGVNLKPKLLDDAMKMMDLDGSGSVEFEEFAVCEFRTARTPSGAASFLPMRCVSVRVRVVET